MVRAKNEPTRCCPTDQGKRSFQFFAQLHEVPQDSKVSSCEPPPAKRPRVKISDEEEDLKELLSDLPHSIKIHKGVHRNVLHTKTIFDLEIPVMPGFSKIFLDYSRYDLHFNETTAVLLYFKGANTQPSEWTDCHLKDLTVVIHMVSMDYFYVQGSVTSDGFMHLAVYLKKTALLSGDRIATDFKKMRKQEDFLKISTCLASFFAVDGKDLPNTRPLIYDPQSESFDELPQLVRRLYSAVQAHHDESHEVWSSSSIDPQHLSLLATLRPYQADAVRWMLHQEAEPKSAVKPYLNGFHQFALSDQQLQFCQYTARIFESVPQPRARTPGGILADEMGLGKTVEVISLILCRPHPGLTAPEPLPVMEAEQLEKLNARWKTKKDKEDYALRCICGKLSQRKSHHRVQCSLCALWQHQKCVQYDLMDPLRGEYRCPSCWVQMKLESKATLIVSPEHIWHQWKSEIAVHVKKEALNVIVYEGVKKTKFIQPQVLARADIVLTTYSVLRRELRLNEALEQRTMYCRREQTYLPLSCPLLSVKWWRLCLDEAQMVERTSTMIAQMASKLEAKHRWCITGTPVQRSIDDLQGLLNFLGVEPYSNRDWWQCLLYQPFLRGQNESMLEVMSTLMWRNTKQRVKDQLGIPPLTERVCSLELSPVERQFYTQVLARTRQALQDRVTHLLTTGHDRTTHLSQLPTADTRSLLPQLTMLRQACTHPSLVFESTTGGKRQSRATCLSMTEVLERMITKERRRCEEFLRRWVLAKHGEAAINIMQNQISEAADCYREVLEAMVQYERYEVQMDSAQRIHALTNLSWLLNTHPDHVQRREAVDDNLKEKANLIRVEYLKKHDQQVARAADGLGPVIEMIDAAVGPGNEDRALSWLVTTMDLLEQHGFADQVSSMVAATDSNVLFGGLLVHGCSGATYKSLLVSELSKLLKSRQRLRKKLAPYETSWNDVCSGGEVDRTLLQRYWACCLAEGGTEKDKSACPNCVLEVAFGEYERHLAGRFLDHHKRKDILVEMRHPITSAFAVILQQLTQCRGLEGLDDLRQTGTKILAALRALTKELLLVSKFQLATREWWAVHREVELFVTRLQDNSPDDSAFMSGAEAPEQRAVFELTGAQSRRDLESHVHTLTFLRNSRNGELPFCPVCRGHMSPDLPSFVLLHCWHAICLDCHGKYSRMDRIGRKCPICRAHFTHTDLYSPVVTSYTRETQLTRGDADPEHIVGDHSSKVKAVIRCLKTIRAGDPDAKTIVFSSWPTVLKTIQEGLAQNGFEHAIFLHARDVGRLNSFRHRSDVRVLLIPTELGANGLNLVEANNLILVDPLLNPGQEAQAIARIHRIGQTRSTTVHRLVVRDSVEEVLHSLHAQARAWAAVSGAKMGGTARTDQAAGDLTLGDLCLLFGLDGQGGDEVVDTWGVGHRLGGASASDTGGRNEESRLNVTQFPGAESSNNTTEDIVQDPWGAGYRLGGGD